MRKIAYLPFAIAVALSSGYAVAGTSLTDADTSFEERVEKLENSVDRLDNFNFAGYFRGGWTTTDTGSTDATVTVGKGILANGTSYTRGNWAQGALGRLGNEFYGWYDFLLSKQFYDKDGVTMKAVVMMDGSLSMQQSPGNITAGDGESFTFSDMYLSTKGLIKDNPSAEFWVGKHGLPVKAIKLFDWKYLHNSIGAGIGLQNYKLDKGNFNIALSRYDYSVYKTDISGTTKVNTNSVQTRWNDIPVADDLSLDLFADYVLANKSDDVKELEDAGTLFTLKDSGMIGGALKKKYADGSFNEFVVQAANNGMASNMARIHGANPILAHGGNYLGEQSGGSLVRFVTQGENFVGDHFGIAHAAAVATSSDIVDPETWSAHSDIDYFRAAIRPAYIWANNNQTGVELGYFKQESKTDGETLTESGFKTTLYHALKFGKSINTTPEIRFYASYLKALDNELDNVVFAGGQDHEIQFGVTADVAFW